MTENAYSALDKPQNGEPVPVVVLTRDEVTAGAIAGVLHEADAIFRGAKQTVPDVGEKGLGWARNVEAACAELALAKFLDRFPGAIRQKRFRDSDLGDVAGVQVRSTTNPRGPLIVRPHDRDDDVFVLVVGSAPVYRLVGWLRACDAKRSEFRDDPGGRGRPCFCVPQDALIRIPDRRRT